MLKQKRANSPNTTGKERGRTNDLEAIVDKQFNPNSFGYSKWRKNVREAATCASFS
jgi:hypothetical protein